MKLRTLILCFVCVLADKDNDQDQDKDKEPDHAWPWTPDQSELDIGAHATLTEVLGAHNHTLQVLMDTEHEFMAIKDHYFHGCYLLDAKAAHLTTQTILDEIKTQKVAVLPGQFDIQYPPIPVDDVRKKFGHRISQFCLHNPTLWLIKHEAPKEAPESQTPYQPRQ